MKLVRCIFSALLVLASAWLNAGESKHEMTMHTSAQDEIIIEYWVEHEGSKVSVRFSDPKYRKLSGAHKKYDRKNLNVWCFVDRKSKYGDGRVKLNENSIPIKLLSTQRAVFNKSDHEDGYVVLCDDGNKLEFTISDSSSPTVVIPLYMVDCEDGRKYKLIDNAKSPLTINLTPPAARVKKNANAPAEQKGDPNEYVDTDETISVPEDFPLPPDAGGANVAGTIEKVQWLLDNLKGAPDSEIKQAMAELVSMRDYASDEEKAKIDLLKSKYETKRESAEAAAELRKKQEQDSIAAAIKKKEEIEESETWLKVGLGILIAILLFVGNHVMQTLRNKAQMRSMQELQDRAMHQAESAVTHKARSAVDRKVHQAERAAEHAVRRGVGRAGAAMGAGTTSRQSAHAHDDMMAASSRSADDALAGEVSQRPYEQPAETAAERAARRKVERANETLQEKAERAARGARINKNRDKDGKISI